LRNEIFPEYKAHRDATWRLKKIAVPYKNYCAMHIPIIEVKGFEADDLIGTIAKQAEKENYKVYGNS
jgi:DNA polymerase-1